jgi:predicted HD phosphohydrolase
MSFSAEKREEVVVAALLHDVGDLLAPANHAALAAEILIVRQIFAREPWGEHTQQE